MHKGYFAVSQSKKRLDFRDVEFRDLIYRWCSGGRSVFSSANDMLIWDQFWYGNELVSEANLAEATIQLVLNNGEISDYGFGWMVSDNGLSHQRAWMGANTVIIRNTSRLA